MKLFGTDGIRGKAGEYPLDDRTVRIIGAAAAGVLKRSDRKPLVVIGRDTRESGQGIVANLRKGFAGAGVEVWDLGVIPTPGVAYIVKRMPVLAGVVVSASHNPFEDNGIKFFGPRGTKLPDAVEARIEKLIREIEQGGVTATAGRVARAAARSQAALVKEYGIFLQGSISRMRDLRGLRLVVDAANGATSRLAARLFSALGADVSALNAAPDGRNINLDCGSLHPEKLAAEVAARSADCGIAFDGDGDRVIFVDEQGEVRDGDYLLAVASLFLKERGKLRNDTLVTTVMANLGLFKAMDTRGVRVIQTAVGDRYVYEAMRKSGAILGGEQSGHIIFRRYLPTGDGMLSALQILNVMRQTGQPLSLLCSVMQKYPQVLLNTRVSAKVPIDDLPLTLSAVRDVENRLKADGRVLVRYSGTENLLRVMIEGTDKALIGSMAQEISYTAQKEIDNRAVMQ